MASKLEGVACGIEVDGAVGSDVDEIGAHSVYVAEHWPASSEVTLCWFAARVEADV